MYRKVKRIHLIGIGGIGMSGIAALLLRNGYEVTGSDLNRGDAVRGLEALGIRVFLGHASEHIHGADLVVHSSAVSPSNPEMGAAIENHIPVIGRADMLAELMRLKYGVAIAGAHGKTTTTSMIATALVQADLDPTIVVGGRMDNFGGTNARLGSGEFMVVEADESDGTFSRLSPSIAVVTNIDREHMDYFRTMRNLRRAFLDFLNKVPFYGLSVLHGDDPSLRLIAHRVTRRSKTYGFGKHNAYRIVHYRSKEGLVECEFECEGERDMLRLQVPGRHNALNALAAIAVCDELSIPRSRSLEALLSFQGVQRRFHRRGERDGVIFIDDYAHHPRELKATLLAARERFPEARLHAIFQPHRFSRLEDLFDDFASSFSLCSSVKVLDVYAAGEIAIPGVDSAVLTDAMEREGTRAEHVESAKLAVHRLMEECEPGDVILTLGAGDLPNVYRDLF